MTRLETMMEYLKPYAVRKLEEHLKKQKKQSPDQLLLRVEEVLEKALETQRQFLVYGWDGSIVSAQGEALDCGNFQYTKYSSSELTELNKSIPAIFKGAMSEKK